MRLRTILELLLVLSLAAVVGGFLFLRSLDLGAYRERIADRIRDATGREVKIRSGLRVELSLTPTISVSGLVVGNASGSTGPPLLQAERLKMRLRLVPLFSRRLEVERVVLSGAEIALETDQQGKGNWVFDGSVETTPQALAEVRLEDSKVRYFDQGSDWRSEIGLSRFSARREEGSLTRYRFQGMLHSGASDLEGAGLLDLGSERVRLEAKLVSGHFDLDDVSLQRRAGVRSFLDLRIPFNGLKSLDGRLHVDAQSVVIGSITLDEIVSDLDLRRGFLAFESLTARLADGALKAAATVDAREEIPRVAAKLSVEKADLNRLWKELGVSSVVEGKAVLDADLKGEGDSARALLASLNGEATLAMGEGWVRTSVIDRISPDLLPSIAPWASEEKNTRVNCAFGRFDFRSGRGASRVLLDTARMTLAGKGEIDLSSQTMELSIEPSPKDLSLTRVALPITIRGPLSAPDAYSDKAAIFEMLGDTMFRTMLLPPALLGRLLDLGIGEKNPCVQTIAGVDGGTRSMLEQRRATSGGVAGFFRSVGDGVKGTGERMKRIFDPRRW